MSSETPLPLDAVDQGGTARAGGDAAAGTVPLPLNATGERAAAPQPGGDVTTGAAPLPLGDAAAFQPAGDAAGGTVPLPLDAAGGAAGATNPGGVTAAGTAPLSLDATGAVAVAAVSQPDATVPLPYDGASRD